jgi:hypothetical protein
MKEKKQSRQKDAYTIELEHIHSDFKIFGEGLSLVRDGVRGINHRLDKVEEHLINLETEVALIRHSQVTRDEFKFLETRVARLERKSR